MRRFNISPRRRRNKTDATPSNKGISNAATSTKPPATPRVTKPTPSPRVATPVVAVESSRSTPVPVPVPKPSPSSASVSSIRNPFKKIKKLKIKTSASPTPLAVDGAINSSSHSLLAEGGARTSDREEGYFPSTPASIHSSLQQYDPSVDINVDYGISSALARGDLDDTSTIGDSTIGNNTLGTYETNASDNKSMSSRRIGRLNKKKRALFKKLASSREKQQIHSSSSANGKEGPSSTAKILESSFQMSQVDTKSFARTSILPSRIESHSSEFSFVNNEDDDEYDDYMNVDPWSPNISRELGDGDGHDDGEPAFASDPFANFNIEKAMEEESKMKTQGGTSSGSKDVDADENIVDGIQLLSVPTDEKINTVIDISHSQDETLEEEAMKGSRLSSSPPPPPRSSKSPFLSHVGSDVRVNSGSASVASRVSSIGNSLEDGFDEPIMHITDYMKLSESDRLQAYCDLFSTAANMMKDVEEKRQEIFDMGRQVDELYHRVVEFDEEKKKYMIKDEESQREIRRLQDAVNDRHIRSGLDLRSVLSSRGGHSRQPSEEAMLRTELEAKDVIIEALKKSVDEWKAQDQQQERRQEQEKRDDSEVERMQKLLADKEAALKTLQFEMEKKVAEKDLKLKEKNQAIEKKNEEVTKMRERVDENERILHDLQSKPRSVSQLNKKIMALASGELQSVKKELEEAKRAAGAYETRIAKLESEKSAELESMKNEYETKLDELKRKKPHQVGLMNESIKINIDDNNVNSPGKSSDQTKNTTDSSSVDVTDGQSEAATSSFTQTRDIPIPVGTVKARIAMAAARVAQNSTSGSLPHRQMQQKEPQDSVAKNLTPFSDTVNNHSNINGKQKTKGGDYGTKESDSVEKIMEKLRQKEILIKKLEEDNRKNVNNLLVEKTVVEERASELEKRLAVIEIEMKEVSEARSEKSADGQKGQSSSVPEKCDEQSSPVESSALLSISEPVTNGDKSYQDVALQSSFPINDDIFQNNNEEVCSDKLTEEINTIRDENVSLRAIILEKDKKIEENNGEIEEINGLLQETILSIKGWNEEIDNEEFLRNESNGRPEHDDENTSKSSSKRKRFVNVTQYTDEEVIQLEKLAKIHQLSVIRQLRTIYSLEQESKKYALELENVRIEAKANEEKVRVLETQFAELNNGIDKNQSAAQESCASDDGETSSSIIKIDAAYVSSLETDLTRNKETITELNNKIRQLKQRNLSLRAKMKPEDELRAQLDDLRLKLQAKDLEVVELEKAYMAQSNADEKLSQIMQSSPNSNENKIRVSDNEEMNVEELRNNLAKRDELVSQLKGRLSKLENQSGGGNSVLDLRKVSLLQEMQDAIIRRLNLLMNRIDDNRGEREEELDECTTPCVQFLISMSDKLSLLHDYQKISLHLLQSRLSNEVESLRTGSKPIQMDEEVIARFDRTREAFEDYEKEIKSELHGFDSELKNHHIKLIAKNEVIEKLLKSDVDNRSKIEVLQSELNEFKGLSVYSSVNAGVMARFKQCSELEQELEEKERVIERLNNVIAEYRQHSNQ